MVQLITHFSSWFSEWDRDTHASMTPLDAMHNLLLSFDEHGKPLKLENIED